MKSINAIFERPLQGFLAHKKLPPPRTLQYGYAYGPMVVLGGGAVSYERGTPVAASADVSSRISGSDFGWNPLKPAGVPRS